MSANSPRRTQTVTVAFSLLLLAACAGGSADTTSADTAAPTESRGEETDPTEPPVTDSSVTEPPSTEPPVTEPPVTEPPTDTEAPADDELTAGPTAGPGAPCARGADDDFPAVDCDTPHGAEFAGTVAPPVEVLPVEADEARSLVVAACRESVETLTGRDMSRPGVGVGFSVSSGLGEPITDDIACFASTNADDVLVGSIADIGLEAAQTKIIVADEAPGTCFLLDDGNFSWGDRVDCGTSDALMFLGNVALDDGPFPGEDAIREVRTGLCGDLLAASGLAADPGSVSGTFPGENDWNNLGRRNLACDAVPL